MTATPGRLDFFGVGVDAVDRGEAIRTVSAAIAGGRSLFVITPNVDFIMLARETPALRAVFASADLSVCDSMPLVLASRILGCSLPERVNGTDLFLLLCERAARQGWRIFLAGGEVGVPDRTAAVLKERFPGLAIVGCESPPPGFETTSEGAALVRRIRDAAADLLFLALGTPKQERWIHDHLAALGGVVCVGVGASFDFVSGRKRRAPAWMQRSGLEWLFRLATEPRRLWQRYLARDLPFVGLVAREVLTRAVRRERALKGRPA